jgi:hypothetical protein
MLLGRHVTKKLNFNFCLCFLMKDNVNNIHFYQPGSFQQSNDQKRTFCKKCIKQPDVLKLNKFFS